MQDVTEGGCHCGALRYRLEGALTRCCPLPLHDLSAASGGLVVTWLTLPRSGFQWLAGEPNCYVAPASCSRYFCGHCGAHVALVSCAQPAHASM